ncbi:accessory Sec system S-layer assembly protein [Falsibacillus pallidus]|uniref:accessory Sec system S-layer assembly protein n=1 Tax=Falsibacillus pallidus TaxID=493781 RepID=UPI003D975299
MLNFLKRGKSKMEKQGTDSTVDSSELLGGEASSAEKEVKTTLSFHPDANVGSEEKYYFQFLNNELEPLKVNQISLSGIELKQNGSDLYVTAFVRNSLPKGIKFQEMPLLLLGPNGEKLGRKVFDLSQLGELPAESSRPWQFVFSESDLMVSEFPQTEWKLAFELKKAPAPHSLDLEETWEKSLANEDREKLDQLVKSMTPPKPGEVNFMGIQAKQGEDGSLHVTLLIRNGSEKNLTLKQLPLIVEDASGEIIAKGGFQLNDLEVKSNTSKPWTFIFPASLLHKDDVDLTKWKAYPPQG